MQAKPVRNPKQVSIIGAGVAGLTAAIALHRSGHQVQVFERVQRMSEVGAGLTLWSNAMIACDMLGIGLEVRKIGREVRTSQIRQANGTVLSELDATAASNIIGAPTLAVHRGDLQRVLLEALPAGIVQTGKRFNHFTVDKQTHSVTTYFEDGSTAECDVLVGADGIWSQVREQIHGSQAPRYAGYVSWRGIMQSDDELTSEAPVFESWGQGQRFGYVPLTGNRVYWFAVANASAGQERSDDHHARLQELFGNWHTPIPETIRITPSRQILLNDIIDRPPLDSWGIGPVTLIGDAAHPTTPNMGQGACLGIEDAVVLRNSLSRNAITDVALRIFEQARMPRTRMIVDRSWSFGRITQTENGLLCALRDQIARLIPQSITQNQVVPMFNWKPEVSFEERVPTD